MNSQTRIKIRKQLIEHFPQHCVTFIFSGLPVRKSADATYPFFTNRNFLYASGIEEEGAILVFDNDKEILFIRDIDPLMEKWNGRFIRKAEATAISGIKDVRYFSEFDKYLNQVLSRKTRIGLDLDQNQFTEEAYGSAISMSDYVGIERVMDVSDIFVHARMVKFPEEVEAIKKALELTDTAIKTMLKEMKPGNNENDMASAFKYETERHMGSLMFDTIIASGKDATILHYIENNQELKDNEMVLVDLGSSLNGYGADISRTYPINGQYTARQKEVYNAVHSVFKAINKTAKPGMSLAQLNEYAKELLAKACVDLGLQGDVSEYYYHGIGHSLGMDTHDVWVDRDFPLEKGNVITNEPGLYIAEENIGVRIETDLLITEDGAEDLAPFIPSDADEIESMLK